MRLAPLFKQATDQPTPPSPLHVHEPEAEPAASCRTRAWLLGRPLPRPGAHGAVNTAEDPALHEMRVASLDRGLLWNEATPRPSAAAARSAPITLTHPASAAFATALTSSQQTSDTDDRIMQGLRVKTEQQRRMAAAPAAVQLAGKLAAAAAAASAGQLSSPDRVKTTVTVAVAAAVLATSATLAAVFSSTSDVSIDSSAKTCKSGGSKIRRGTGEAMTFAALSYVLGQRPRLRLLDHVPEAGLLFSTAQPSQRALSAAARMQAALSTPQPSISAPRQGAATSLPAPPSDQSRNPSPAASITSDKENVSPAKPVVPIAAADNAPAYVRMELSERLASEATARSALAAEPTLPPRDARRGRQTAPSAWQVNDLP